MSAPAQPATPAAPSFFGSLTNMFSVPKKPANAVPPAPAQGGGRRKRGKKTRASRSRRHRTRRHRK